LREKLPVPSASRRASGNKSDKAVADSVFVPARQMVPEKTSRTLREWCKAGNAACMNSLRRRNPVRHEFRRLFKRRATSSAFSLLLKAEMRK